MRSVDRTHNERAKHRLPRQVDAPHVRDLGERQGELGHQAKEVRYKATGDANGQNRYVQAVRVARFDA